MRNSIKKGLGFGLTSGVITTLGLIIGLYSSTESKWIIIGGVLIIAIADSLSDAMGIHISEETSIKDSKKIWAATISTFISKLIFALTFVIPLLIFSIDLAIIFSIFWGLLLISALSAYISKKNNTKPYKAIIEHLILAIFVIVVTYLIGRFIHSIIY